MTPTTTVPYPPGPTAHESRKLLLAFRRDTLKFWCDLHDTYGDFVQFTLGGTHMFALRDPHLIREVLVEKNDVMRRTDYTWDTLGRFLGEGLVVSHGATHRRRRSLIQPLFTPTWIASYLPEIRACVAELTASWVSGTHRNLADDMHHLTLSIIYRTIFGAETGEYEAQIKEAIAVIQAASAQRMQVGSIQIADAEIDRTLTTLHDAIDDLIARRRRDSTRDLLSLLIGGANSADLGLTDKEVREEAITFFMAGQETSANALAWVWYLLGQHPDVLLGLQDEIRTVTQQQPVAIGMLDRLPYLQAVQKEALRLYPPAWIIGRCPTERIELGGCIIEPNTPINICLYALHRHPQVFPDPNAFIPERFAIDPPRYSYLPFGGGPHVCIGQPLAQLEMSVALVTILQHWHIRITNEQVVVPEAMMTLRPAPSISAEVIRR